MCRILVSSFSNQYFGLFREITYDFIRASERDVLLEKARKISSKLSHGDGWGLVAIGLADTSPAILFHKTIIPIYHDLSREIIELFLNRIALYNDVKILLHTRLSSRREPYGEKYTHPFEVASDKIALWFIHNGGVDKKDISKELGLNPYYYTDSWIGAIYISNYLNKCIVKESDIDNCVVEAYRNLVKYTLENSALNTGLLILYDEKPHLYTSFYVREYKDMDSNWREYYNMYSFVHGDFSVVSSSTTRFYSKRDFKSIEQGLFIVRNNGLVKLDSYE